MAKPGKSAKPKPTASVRIDEELRYKADMYATKHKKTLKEVLNAAVAEYLQKNA